MDDTFGFFVKQKFLGNSNESWHFEKHEIQEVDWLLHLYFKFKICKEELESSLFKILSISFI